MSFHESFADELVKIAAPPISKKQIPPELLAKIKRGAGRFASGTALAALFHGLIDSEVSGGRAVAGGAALTGGGMAGGALGKKIGMGGRGQGVASLLGSIAGLRALRNREKSKAGRGR
ncbi:MAG: hypothetical protein JRG90_12600 [Deltaproteobacteria bacterium]|nr:hypothetical protein [Deltaproteobacteria bacterium]